MIVNKKISEVLKEIATENIKYLNTPDKERKYLRRLLNLFKNHLTEDEQIFVFKLILEQIHYRSIISDPDNIIQIHNVKLKTITYVFLLTVILVIIIAMIFKVNESLNSILDILTKVFRIITL